VWKNTDDLFPLTRTKFVKKEFTDLGSAKLESLGWDQAGFAKEMDNPNIPPSIMLMVVFYTVVVCGHLASSQVGLGRCVLFVWGSRLSQIL
jgi:hypothetical protein